MGIDMVSKKYSNDKTISHLNYSPSSCLYKKLCLLFFYAPRPSTMLQQLRQTHWDQAQTWPRLEI